MSETVVPVVSAILILAGAFFTLVAAIGLLRLPDLFTRMHAASKAGTAGSGLVLIAVALGAGEWSIWLKCMAAIVFFVLTAPLSAHLLARAALASRSKTGLFDTETGSGP